MTTQAEVLAKILLDMGPFPDGPPTVRAVINALNKAYREGFDAGIRASHDHRAQIDGVIEQLGLR